MRGAIPCSHWSALPVKMISTHRISWSPIRKSRNWGAIARLPAGGRQPAPDRLPGRGGRANKSGSASLQSELSAALSASLRVELLRQIEGLSSADHAALWAQRRLTAKNQLSAADARQIEEAFATRLGVIRAENAKADEATATLKGAEKTRTPQTDKSVVVFPEPRRIRDRDHVRHVMKQPCLICGRRPSDPHHLR